MAMTLNSPAFKQDDEILSKYTCEGEDVSPAARLRGMGRPGLKATFTSCAIRVSRLLSCAPSARDFNAAERWLRRLLTPAMQKEFSPRQFGGPVRSAPVATKTPGERAGDLPIHPIGGIAPVHRLKSQFDGGLLRKNRPGLLVKNQSLAVR